MRKGLARTPQGEVPAMRGRNYITPGGLQRLKDEHRFLLTRDRPAAVEVVITTTVHREPAELCGSPNVFWEMRDLTRRQ